MENDRPAVGSLSPFEETMKIALAQINTTVADIPGNRDAIIAYIRKARDAGAHLVVFPEMATIGYPPMDLLENQKLVEDNLISLDAIAGECRGISAICGYVDFDRDMPPLLFNAAAFMSDGSVRSRHFKTLLPAYDVFDEMRYFSNGRDHEPVDFMGRRIGITVCEDIWTVSGSDEKRYMEQRRYTVNPAAILSGKGIDLLVNISASPFVRGKINAKRHLLSTLSSEHSVGVAYVNQVGGNDSLIFDGRSMFFDAGGRLVGQAKSFQEDLLVIDDERLAEVTGTDDGIEDIRQALVLGIRDYVCKCGFSRVVIGLSGGIDSALTATLAVQALGPEHVSGVTMPSEYSSRGSIDDSLALADRLGIKCDIVPIRGLFDRYRTDLATLFAGLQEDITEENIQARIRGNILMAVSNKTRSLVLSTGNKSELAMGYCTLYGDMSGGLAVISDLPKTLVYELSRHINRNGEIIPEATIEKPPSAELRPNQKDQDTLPPYEILDRILELYIEERLSAAEIAAHGFGDGLVRDILHKIDLNEYKRLQAAPGLKVTAKAFGRGRRIPIAQKFRH